MVSFVCDVCQDTLKKAKLDQHKGRCHGASFSCIDCGTSFKGVEHRAHTSCISEAEKYEKPALKGPKKGKMNNSSGTNKKESQALPEKPCPIVDQIKKQKEEKQGKKISAAEAAKGEKEPLTPNKRKADTKEFGAGDKEDSSKKPKIDKTTETRKETETEENVETKMPKEKVNGEELTLKTNKADEDAKEVEKKKDKKKNKKDKHELKDGVIEAEIAEMSGRENECVAEPADKEDTEMVNCEQDAKQDTNARKAQGVRKRGMRKRKNKNKDASIPGDSAFEGSPRKENTAVKGKQLSAVNVAKEIKKVLMEAGVALSFSALRAKLLEKYEQPQSLEAVEKLMVDNVKLVFKGGVVQMA